MSNYYFDPQMGTEGKILVQEQIKGKLYFSTDTRKIYLDMEDGPDKDKGKVPMGGNVGLFYGKMKPTIVVDNQEEFNFTLNDLIPNSADSKILVPNVDDLILNEDGCFYKVISVIGEGEDVVLTTRKLTIAGTGGGQISGPSTPGTDESDLTSFKVGRFNVLNRAILKGSPCIVQFIVKATDDLGDYLTGEVGSYELWVNNKRVDQGSVVGIPRGDSEDSPNSFEAKYVNNIDIAPFLPLQDNISPILIIFDKNGVQRASRNLSSISVSAVSLEWGYINKTLNYNIENENESMRLEWKVTGDKLEKTTYITIGNLTKEIASGTGNEFFYDLNFKEFNMTHGAYTAKMWSEIKIGNTTVPTDPIYKNIIVATPGNENTIVSVCLFESMQLVQYNTFEIPVYIYRESNSNTSVASVTLWENGEKKDFWQNVPNLGADEKKSIWYYTPEISGEGISLSVSCGGTVVSIPVIIEDVGIDIEEVPGYAFKLKASDHGSNESVQNWKIGENKGLSFSDNFDWINGGKNSEPDDDGGYRQYIAVKAGTTMTINYPIWERNAAGTGKHFKFIFKATDCRDYDAQVLSCKINKKIIHIDQTLEYFWLTQPQETLTHSTIARLNNGVIELDDTKTEILDITNEDSRNKFANTYAQFEGEIYQCAFICPDPEKPNEVYNTWYKLSVQDSFNGLLLKAQNGMFRSNDSVLEVHYCEDTYIELELEIVNKNSGKRYIKFWIDGIPCGYVEYPTSDIFQIDDIGIEIGSPKCDVYVYLAKLYEKDLSVEDHMKNFYRDAPNAEEMVRRYQRNDIMGKDTFKNEIDMYALAQKNPKCLVHHYEVSRMPYLKSTEISGCSYAQYQGSSEAKYYAENVMIKVQGTSSEKYVVSAANLDTDFNYTGNGNVPSGLIDGKTHEKLVDGWSMDGGTAIPVNFTCTKVNVASCENVNNVVNQEWYNMFQPYKSELRRKNPRTRDTMQFTPGVIFITDHSSKNNDSTGVQNNVFADTVLDGKPYIGNAYAKMYSLGQMGNSKDNIHVFHDLDNPLDCCIEVKDNQMPQQWMAIASDIGEGEDFFSFRYPNKLKTVQKMPNGQELINNWNRLIEWMAASDPQPKYNKFTEIDTEDKYKKISVNKKTLMPIQMYIMNEDQTDYIECNEYNPEINTYYSLTAHENGYTNLRFKDGNSKTFAKKTFSSENNPYVRLLDGCVVNTYEGTYDRDTYEYRMAKMLDECEDYLIMESILYHYLFIERHCMIDNVAKNTFWSTEDGVHWSMIKDYDNDTSDGNDNNGKLTRTYGMEPTDKLNPNAYVFNANESVWFNFVHGLYPALSWMYQKLENETVTRNGKTFNVWDPEAYLDYCSELQSAIPERCWIEDYYRKYFRPNEVYHDTMYNSMLSGGQKKYQRKQYEIYQNLYMSSKYQGTAAKASQIKFRPTGEGLIGIQIPIETYSDCYVYTDVGQTIARVRTKRNQEQYITCPVDTVGNATMYIYPASVLTKMGNYTNAGQLGHFAPDQMNFSGASKLQEIIYATPSSSTSNHGLKDTIEFGSNRLLEKVYLCNLPKCEAGLDMSDCVNLKELNCLKSGFTAIQIADGAPIEKMHLNNPTSLTLKNLFYLNDFEISLYDKLKVLRLENIDKAKQNLSKQILSSSIDHVNPNNSTINTVVRYKITDANWSIDEAEEIQNDSSIVLLDQMLDERYAITALDDEEINNLPYSKAFTGNITIKETAYNKNNPLVFYETYTTPETFINVDLNFESENSKLYNIIIYDGDQIPIWKRKVAAGTALSGDLLNGGPYGEFNIESLIKSPTDQHKYTLLEKWVIKNNSGETIKIIESEKPIDANYQIVQDIHIYSQFDESINNHRVEVKMEHPITREIITLVEPAQYDYDTLFTDIIPTSPPYINATGLKDFQAYDFVGYALTKGGTVTVSNKARVTGPATLWATFKLVDDIRIITHPEWFTIEPHTISREETEIDQLLVGTFGAKLSPKPGIKLGGKITIPAKVEIEGKMVPVIALKGFGGNSNTSTQSPHEITHIFMEKDKENQLYIIEQEAFYNSPFLEDFDFDESSIQIIKDRAFQLCRNLKVNTFGDSLLYIGARAFNQSLKGDGVVVQLPASLKKINTHGFYVVGYTNSKLMIGGQKGKLSQLDFSDNIEAGTLPFGQNANKFTGIEFYSAIYPARTQVESGEDAVALILKAACDTGISILN